MAARTPKAGPKLADRLLGVALGYPEAWEDHPWGDTVAKVRTKIFVFVGVHEERMGLTVKLPESAEFALAFPWAEKTGYGLGKAGWVTAWFPVGADVPVDLLEEWIDESYRAVAPKTLVKRLDG
ncbi:MAG TPA: MmcQ/YjbR family DNA-binding protein [Acidimicrobiia bacterium]|nr:MmcQ/YjbR family DNA-binding protein [Acidimicrobiia bacterium]